MLQRNEQGICRFIEMTVISINRLTVSNSCKPYVTQHTERMLRAGFDLSRGSLRL